MDIRDINEEVIYPGKKALGEMFKLQKVLVDHYVGIEGLPQYPIDINTKSSQNLIKDFISRVIEELGEGFESYEIMLDLFHKGADRSVIIPHLQNFNEEISDAIHFWLELMIFSGFETSRMAGWFGKNSLYKGLLEYYQDYATKEVDKELGFKKFPIFKVIRDEDLNDKFLTGGRGLSNEVFNQMKIYLWDITYHLQIARNTLKNKPWKQTPMMTDEGLYEGNIREATIALFKFMSFTGFTPESIYEIYYKKNKVNEFRIKSKY